MKKITTLLFILVSVCCGLSAQNYKMINASSEYFYSRSLSSSNDTVFGFKCDSVNFITGDSVFYPYRTLAYIAPVTDPCNMDAEYPIWAGPKISIDANNLHKWGMRNGDSILFDTQIPVGDTQLIYLHPNGHRTVAIHTSNGLLTFANVTDSVQYHTLRTLDIANTVVINFFNGKEIIISKNNGVVQMPSVVNFPNDTFMYSRIAAKRLKYGDLYPWQPGDELHEVYYSHSFSNQSSTTDRYNKFILARNQVTSDSVRFTVRRIKHHTSNWPPANTITIDTITVSVGRLSYYIETAMPQQTIYGINNTAYTYDLMYQAVDCGKLAMVNHVMNSVHVDSCTYFEMFEPFIHDDIYVEGVAGYYYSEQPHFFNSYSQISFYHNYYYINGNSCGTPLYVNVEEENSTLQMHSWPNPASNVLNFDLPAGFYGTIEIYDLSGKLVQAAPLKQNIPLNIESLSDGIYIGKITSGGMQQGFIRFAKN